MKDVAPSADAWRVPLSDVCVDAEVVQAASDVVASGWWSMGARVEEFEAEFARFCGVRHALAVSSGTAALHLALMATGCGPGDDVLVPSLNFVAAANTIVHVGAEPRFCDIRGGDDLNLDPASVEAAISAATKAIVVLHYGGFPCDMESILQIAAERGLIVIEDAAHAPGALWRGRACGTIGAVGCFSFFANKNLPTGEGGMVVTDDDELAARLRLLRSHGMTTLTWERHRGHAHSYDVTLPGFNYRLDELRAAVGSVYLRRLPELNRRRGEILDGYRSRLAGVSSIRMAFSDTPESNVSAHHLAVAVLSEAGLRDGVRTRLAEARIQTSVHYPPIHLFSAYRGSQQTRLPRTESVAPRLITLPLYPHMTNEQLELVAVTLLDALEERR